MEADTWYHRPLWETPKDSASHATAPKRRLLLPNAFGRPYPSYPYPRMAAPGAAASEEALSDMQGTPTLEAPLAEALERLERAVAQCVDPDHEESVDVAESVKPCYEILLLSQASQRSTLHTASTKPLRGWATDLCAVRKGVYLRGLRPAHELSTCITGPCSGFSEGLWFSAIGVCM
jgi:hypothetical protein